MNIIRNFKLLKENLVLLILAALIGLIVSAVAQLFMIVAKNLFIFIFKNKDFVLTFEIGSFSLNLIHLDEVTYPYISPSQYVFLFVDFLIPLKH